MKPLFMALVLACTAHSAGAQTLWRDAPMLASPAHIRALMPEARETSAAQRAADPSALLEIASTSIANERFIATYHFDNQRLQRIRLQSQPDTDARRQALLKALQASLRTRYGLPISAASRPLAPLGSTDLMWAFQRMTVQLLMTDGQTVQLIYSANIPSPTPGL